MAEDLEISTDLTFLRVSPTDIATARGSTAKVIVCEESSSFSSVANVSERKTKCGTKTITDAPTQNVSISGVAGGNLGANHVSAQQLLIWQKAKTLLYFVYRNDSDGGDIDLGDVVYVEGTLRIASVTVTSDGSDGMVTFDVELAVTGDVSYTVPA
jgi:hypothetical protein